MRGQQVIKVALPIDGGHLRSTAGRANIRYDNDFIEDFAKPVTILRQKVCSEFCITTVSSIVESNRFRCRELSKLLQPLMLG